MVILDQNKPIWLILKNKQSKIKKSEFLNWTFIINKNGNKASIQSILKSNSTSFLFNNIFCEININKVIYREARGNVGTHQISSGNCNYSINLDMQVYYLDIQAISTLSCLLLVLDV